MVAAVAHVQLGAESQPRHRHLAKDGHRQRGRDDDAVLILLGGLTAVAHALLGTGEGAAPTVAHIHRLAHNVELSDTQLLASRFAHRLELVEN
eukprot:scaffold24698_cov63-Phaeocystis_antarctica.AAC.4